jgi:DNA-binding PadR family transcriptional regulator
VPPTADSPLLFKLFSTVRCHTNYSYFDPTPTEMAQRRNRDPGALLPLRPIEALILTILAGGDRHGYGIRQDILAHTDGSIELEAGNLYRRMRWLEAEELIEPAPRRPAADEDPRRLYYRMTPFGRRVLVAEMSRMRDLLRLAELHRVIGPRTA